MTNVFLSDINGVDRVLWFDYGYIVKLIGNVKYYKKKKKKKKIAKRELFVYFNCEVFKNCEKVEEDLNRIYCVDLGGMRGATKDFILGLYRGDGCRRVFCLWLFKNIERPCFEGTKLKTFFLGRLTGIDIDI